MNHKGTQTLETEHLILRRFTSEDATAAFRNWTSDSAVTEFLTWKPHENVAVTQAVIENWIASYASPDFYQWAIVPKSLGEPIGTITVVWQSEEIGILRIGYCIGRSFWHQGITSEALASVRDYLFGEVGVNRLEARHDPQNPHSGAVMRKCGMTYEGTLRMADRNNRGIVDVCMYSMLREDWTVRRDRS